MRRSKLRNGKTRPEYKTIQDHLGLIFNKNYKRHKDYKNMPFYDKWNPKMGGSILAGMNWIFANLPKRQQDGHLHIIDKKIGFMPGNLTWIPNGRHKREELLNKVLLENSRLKKKLEQCV